MAALNRNPQKVMKRAHVLHGELLLQSTNDLME